MPIRDPAQYLHFQNISSEISRGRDELPPLLELMKLHEAIAAGKKLELAPLEKKALYLMAYSMTTVYFIVAPEVEMVKIGKTTDLEKRMATLKTMSPTKLQLGVSMDYDDWLESRIHKHFKEHRSHGEWFFADEPIVDFMQGYRDKGIEYVVAEVGDAPRHWMNSRKKAVNGHYLGRISEGADILRIQQ